MFSQCDVVYKISFDCELLHVSQTKRQLKTKLKEHVRYKKIQIVLIGHY